MGEQVTQWKHIELEQCKRTDPRYQDFRNRHYVSNRGCHGQQLHYLVWLSDGDQIILGGIISGASAVWSVKLRDEFFGLTKDNRQGGLPSIVNNVVFRLEVHEKNLATRVLSLWRRRVSADWRAKYGVAVHGFETFVVEEPHRKGALYLADNWTLLGETAGNTKSHKGLANKTERLATTPKLIFCLKIPKTQLSTSYTSTWRRGKPKVGAGGTANEYDGSDMA